MRKKKLTLLVFMIFVSLLLIVTNYYTIRVLSAVRAYIHGESEYSKGQKDASLYLATYIQTGDTVHYESFKTAINIPIGDNIARTALLTNDNEEIVRKGFLMGKNHPDDFNEMIWLFKRFGNISFMKTAIEIWGDAEPLINELNAIGYSLHKQMKETELTEPEKTGAMVRLNAISALLSDKESAFSLALGEAARKIKIYLLIANIFLIIVLLGITAWYSIHAMNRASSFKNELNLKIDELNASNKELEHFAYIASHDLQEPLRKVEGFMTLMQNKYEHQLDEKAKKYISLSLESTARMKMLIKDLLEYSKNSMGKLVFDKTDLNDVLKQVKEDYQEDFTQPGSVFFIAPMPVVKVNKAQMVQLFQNLVGNAVKYRNDTAIQVYITASEHDNHWEFSVKDNGLGIEPRHHKKIFEVFQRLHNQDKYKGTGIGLAICKKIIERHQGKIWIKSEPGEGSTFYFTISKKL